MATKYKMSNGQRILMTDAEEADLIVKSLNIENNKKKIEAPYINQRRNDYPPIGDQLDMLWHSIDQNPKLKSEYFEFYEAIKAVKVKHPKNG
jgi:hypothetical protein